MTTPRSNATLLYLSFAAVYLIWGSSFAASKVVMHDLPPLLAQGVRFTIAGAALAVIAAWRGASLPRAALEWRHFMVMGLLLVVLASGFNALAIRHVASSESALLNVSSAFWIPVLGTLGARGYPLTRRAAAGLLLGFGGVVFLMWPKAGLSVAQLGWQSLILVGCLGWALGTLYYRRISTTTPPLMFTALEMLAGGLTLDALGLASGGLQQWQFTWPSLGGLVFLTVFSSGIAYTSFGYLMRHTTPVRLATYAYVNPVVAALVGRLLLAEQLSRLQLAGMAVILAGVVLVSLPDAGLPPGAGATPPSEATP